jgi:hypothetical protein
MVSFVTLSVLSLQLWSAAAPPAPTIFVVAYDGSRSVPATEFAEYPDMVRAAVLELVAPGDTVVLVRMDRPQDPPETHVFDTRLSRVRARVVEIYERLRAQQRSREGHGTDQRLAFDHVRRRVDLDRRLSSSASHRYVLVAVTDGISDGRQTPVDPVAPGWANGLDWRAVFIGIKPGVESRLQQTAERMGLDDRQRLLLVPFSHWSQLRSSFAGFVDRAPNAALSTVLARAARTTSPAGR